ncbi:MAG: hypothetical protein JW776_12940 [Candidatus Lokiarchaeota archaeon]|nr:hypothetical protein [Candidatus Lokiarchaeota archaeon]
MNVNIRTPTDMSLFTPIQLIFGAIFINFAYLREFFFWFLDDWIFFSVGDSRKGKGRDFDL